MRERHESVIVRTAVRVLVPLMQIFGLYVLFHGHYSPGGGFQGGVILAASYILIGLGLGRESLIKRAPEPTLAALAGIGVLVYGGTGALAFAYGGNFLDYGKVEVFDLVFAHPSEPLRRSLGILLVEIGVAITVSSVLVLIFLRLTDGEAAAAAARPDEA